MSSAHSPRFVHLRLHTEYSITDGIVQIDQAISSAAADGMPALGISDLANLFGMVKFYKGCRGKGIKPIVGADVWIENEVERDKPYRVLLICKNRNGYGQLSELLTRAYLENKHRGRAELRRAWFEDGAASDLLCLSGAMMGDIGQNLVNGNPEIAELLAADWKRMFPGGFYIELQRAGHPGTEAYIRQALVLANKLGLPVVATHPVQFLTREDFKAHEARVCIAQGYVLADKRRPRDFTEEQYLKSQDEMCELFADLPEALENAVEIARRCSLTVQLGKNFLPQFPTPEGMTLDDFLVQEAKDGLERRLVQLYPNPEERERQRQRYEDRLKFETDTIIQMGFPGYFLIVADFIRWGKANGVPVGPGRGSGAGSLVAYSLDITDIDPLEYALLFERFLNPERVSMPDFDIDFCQDNRYRVIEYVRERYGKDAVSQIATFGTMASKAVVRDVGRVLDLPYGLCDRLSKLVPVEGAKPVSLTRAYEMEPQIGDMMKDGNDGESVQELWSLALPLEGLSRNVGMHAGGVLIAPGKLTDFCPLYIADGDDATPVSQFDKDDVEAVGLVKFDFLGLRNLTIIELALQYVERETGKRPDLMSLGFKDPAAYQILKDANTTAIFQVESDGMKKLLKKLAPDRFEDIIAVLALYRPGPLGSGMVDDFILRKKGQQEIDYFHPDLKACLEPTYGVIVYQEQVMQISQIIGGYTLGGADMLRRAMGKKKAEEMAKHRATIADGAKQKGYDPALAEQLFDLMTKFAEYGFNKSHTAAYAVVTYHTAWLKAHYCAAFMAATMSSDLDNTDTVKIFYEDTVANKIEVLPPDVNASDHRARRSQGDPLRSRCGQRGGRTGGARDHRGARERRTLPRPVRLLRACRPSSGQSPGHRGPDPLGRDGYAGGAQGARSRATDGDRVAGHGGRRAGGCQCDAGGPVRHDARGGRGGGRVRQGEAVDRARAPQGREDRDRLLPLRSPLQCLQGRGAPLRAPHAGPDRAVARPDHDGGCGDGGADQGGQPRQDGLRAARRRHAATRGGGLFRGARCQPRQDRHRRGAGDRGQGQQ